MSEHKTVTVWQAMEDAGFHKQAMFRVQRDLERAQYHERLVEILAQCSTELAESIEGKYQGILGYPSTDRDYRADMAIVEEARALLAALEAEKGGEL